MLFLVFELGVACMGDLNVCVRVTSLKKNNLWQNVSMHGGECI